MSLVENLERLMVKSRQLQCLNIFITDLFESQLAQIKADASSFSTEAFPLAVKDCFTTCGITTTCGSKMLASLSPPYTATVVQRLLDSGGILIGKTNMDEFCMGASSTESYFGPVKNPWTLIVRPDCNIDDDWFIPGGSSGGSAVAVACGLAKIALGSDTGGSSRNPAAHCGVVGLKPTYGLLSRSGLIPLVNSLDVPAIITQNVDDAAWALERTAGSDPKDSTSVSSPKPFQKEKINEIPKNLVIGIPKEYYNPGLSLEMWEIWNKITGLLANDGSCIIRQVSLPHTQYSIVCYHVLGECEVASNMARYDGVEYGFRDTKEYNSVDSMYAAGRSSALNEVVRRRILSGNYFLLREHYDRYFLQALRVRRLIAEDFWKLFRPKEFGLNEEEKIDILLTPVTSTDAPLYSEFRGQDGGYERERMDDFYTQPVNMAGVPAVSIPICLSSKGLPIGFQLIADNFEESKLLSVAKWIENEVKFPKLDIDNIISQSDKLKTVQ